MNGRNDQPLRLDSQSFYTPGDPAVQSFVNTQKIQRHQTVARAALLQHYGFAVQRVMGTAAGTVSGVAAQHDAGWRGDSCFGKTDPHSCLHLHDPNTTEIVAQLKAGVNSRGTEKMSLGNLLSANSVL
jgi:tetrahydromethanopterin S-methyltransferase subunit F